MRMDTSQARAGFETARVARLATADGHGRPHLVPIVFALRGDTIYTAVDAKPKSDPAPGGRLRRLDNIRANLLVSVLVDHYAEDWDRLWWARADGTARIIDAAGAAEVDGAAEATAAVAALARRYPQYRDAPPPGPVIAIAVARFTGWAAVDTVPGTGAKGGDSQ
jgi:PPOX class probable F420-dependent enzyme